MISTSIWVSRDDRQVWKLLAALTAVLMVATGLISVLPLTADATSVGSVDPETPGVYLYNAGSDTQGFLSPPPGPCAGLPSTDPTQDTVNIAVSANELYFIGDEASEVIAWTVGATGETAGTGTPDLAIADVTRGLREIDDYGNISNGGDDDANYDAQTGGEITLQLDVDGDWAAPGGTDLALIVPDGVTATGVLEDDPADPFGNLDGAEIFIFEDAETSGMTIELYGPGGVGTVPYTLDIVDYQRNPDTIDAADDTLIAIDLDSLPGFTFRYVEAIRLIDDGVAISPNVSSCPLGPLIDTSLEVDAVATRTDVVLAGPPAIEIEKSTNTVDADNPTGPAIRVGDPVNWTYTVTNTGETPLIDITVTDSDPGVTVVCSGSTNNVVAGPIAPAGTVTCTATGTATSGQYMNLATVTAIPLTPTGDPMPVAQVTDDDPSHYIGVSPSVDVEKFTNSVDSDTAPGETLTTGDAVTWTYRVTNDGDTRLTNITVTDDQVAPSAIDCGNGTNVIAGPIAPNATFDCTATGVVTTGLYTNTATVVGTPVDAAGNTIPGGTVTDTDPSNYTGVDPPPVNPSVIIEKATNTQDADLAPGPTITVGDLVTWTYVVTNDGNVELRNVTVTDNQIAATDIDCGAGTNVIGTMAPTDVATCTATGTATAGAYSNIGTVTGDPYDDGGNPIAGGPTTDTDPSNYLGEELIGTIGDTVWIDLDADGVIDTGETGIAGVTVTLTDAGGTVIDTQVTDSSGNYLFTGVTGGTYTVTVITSTLPAGYAPTYDNDGGLDHVSVLTLAAGGNDLDQDFGYIPPASLDIEKSTNDTDADTAPGVTIQVGDQVTWTYVVVNDGAVTVTNISVTDSVLADSAIDCGDGTNVIASLAPTATQTCTAIGVATEGPYVNIGTASGTGPDGSPVTDTDPSNYVGTPLPLGTIGDTIWLDENSDGIQQASEMGIEGVVVRLTDSAGVTTDVTTDAMGQYLFGSLPAGTYTVTVVSGLPTGVSQTYDIDGTLDNTSTVTIGAGENNLDQDFGYVLPNGSIGDTIWYDLDFDGVVDPDEIGIEGIDVQLIDADGNVVQTVTTDANGNYLFTDVPAGTYTVSVVKTSTILTETIRTFDSDGTLDNTSSVTIAAGESNLDQDFGYAPPAEIGNFVFLDENANGVQDTGETGVEGAVVSIYTVDATGAPDGAPLETQTTGANGEYLFDGLDPREDYVIQIVSPAGTVLTSANSGSDDNLDSDADETTGFTAVISVEPGDSDRSVDAGIVPLNSGISVEKATNDLDSDEAPGQSLGTGSAVVWTYVVENTGGTILVDIVLTDDQEGTITCPQTTLDPGETMTCTADGTVQRGNYANVATVSGTPGDADGNPLPGAVAVTDDDPSHYNGVDVIDLSITPTPTPAPVIPTSTPVVVVVTATPTPIPALFVPIPVEPAPALALTGRDSTDLAVVAGAMLLLGAAFMTAGRRRIYESE